MNLNNYNNRVTVIVVSFYSEGIIENLIKSIDDNIKIIIVENSLNLKLKENIEKKHQNVEVIIPDRNLGNGGGINCGLKKVKTEFALYLDVDTLPEKNMISSLLEYSNIIKDFSILAPKDLSHQYSKDLYINFNESEKFHKMQFITGCAMFIKMEELKKIGLFDENIFLYYEETAFYFRCHKANLGIYLIDSAIFTHIGSSAIDKKYDHQISINRNWHFCWSKFYYYKKNFSYFYGLKKTFPNFIRAIKKYLFFSIKKENKKADLHKAEIRGLLASYMLKKSYYRPNIKI